MKLAWDSKKRVDSHDGGYHRERSADPYHSYRWTRLSLAFRESHPLCERCKRAGIVKAATCVDHIIPYPVCRDFYNRANLQALCDDCNNQKGQEDKAVIDAWRKQHLK